MTYTSPIPLHTSFFFFCHDNVDTQIIEELTLQYIHMSETAHLCSLECIPVTKLNKVWWVWTTLAFDINQIFLPLVYAFVSGEFIWCLPYVCHRNPSAPVKDDLGGDWPEFTTENEAYLSLSRSPRVVNDMGLYRDRVAFWIKQVPELAALTSQSAGAARREEPQQAAKEELWLQLTL